MDDVGSDVTEGIGRGDTNWMKKYGADPEAAIRVCDH